MPCSRNTYWHQFFIYIFMQCFLLKIAQIQSMCPIRPRNWVFSTIAGYLAHVPSLHITPVIHARWHQESHRSWMSFKRDACIEYCKWPTVTTSLMKRFWIPEFQIPDIIVENGNQGWQDISYAYPKTDQLKLLHCVPKKNMWPHFRW